MLPLINHCLSFNKNVLQIWWHILFKIDYTVKEKFHVVERMTGFFLWNILADILYLNENIVNFELFFHSNSDIQPDFFQSHIIQLSWMNSLEIIQNYNFKPLVIFNCGKKSLCFRMNYDKCNNYMKMYTLFVTVICEICKQKYFFWA